MIRGIALGYSMGMGLLLVLTILFRYPYRHSNQCVGYFVQKALSEPQKQLYEIKNSQRSFSDGFPRMHIPDGISAMCHRPTESLQLPGNSGVHGGHQSDQHP